MGAQDRRHARNPCAMHRRNSHRSHPASRSAPVTTTSPPRPRAVASPSVGSTSTPGIWQNSHSRIWDGTRGSDKDTHRTGRKVLAPVDSSNTCWKHTWFRSANPSSAGINHTQFTFAAAISLWVGCYSVERTLRQGQQFGNLQHCDRAGRAGIRHTFSLLV